MVNTNATCYLTAPAGATPYTYTYSFTVATCGSNLTLNYTGHTNNTCGGATCFTGAAGAPASVPVSWLSFDANQQEGNNIVLDWSTASEIDCDKFIIQRKLEGVEGFQDIGVVNGSGISNSTQNYQYIDMHNQSERPCYRLMQIDYDGTSELTYAVPVSKQVELELMIFPNPAQNETNIAVLGDEEIQSLRVVDVFGKDVSGDVVMQQESGIYTLDVSGLRSGTYFVEVITETQKTIERIQLAR